MRGGWRERFFQLLENDDREGHCASRAGVTPEYVSRLKAKDPAFRAEIARRIAIYWSKETAAALQGQRREQAAFR
jgi:hypothetical protein